MHIIYIHRNVNFLAISTTVFHIFIFIANHDVSAARLFPKHLLLSMSCLEKVTWGGVKTSGETKYVNVIRTKGLVKWTISHYRTNTTKIYHSFIFWSSENLGRKKGLKICDSWYQFNWIGIGNGIEGYRDLPFHVEDGDGRQILELNVLIWPCWYKVRRYNRIWTSFIIVLKEQQFQI